jgi:alanine racemase
LHLGADVLDVRPVRAGQHAGYRQGTVRCDGTIVVIAAGSAHGVQPLDDGRSPFHFARRRLALLEPPHMHTSMAVVPDGDPTPRPGDIVDVQRPLISTFVDEVRWR